MKDSWGGSQGALAVVAGAAVAALVGCSDALRSGDGGADRGLSDGGVSDARARDAAVDAGHDLDTLRLVGRLTIGASPAVNVNVIARCGSKVARATSDDAGAYSLVADVAGCSPLVVEFNQRAFVPNFRVIHLPPPASPLTLNLELSPASQFVCGDAECRFEGYSGQNLTIQRDGVLSQGWGMLQTGSAALPFVPGEFRQRDGTLARIFSFGYYDFQDAQGHTLGAGVYPNPALGADGRQFCAAVDAEVQDWFGDLTGGAGSSEAAAQLISYTFDPPSGRWTESGPTGRVGFTCGYDEQSRPMIHFAPAKALDDIRASTFYVDAQTCAQVAGPGDGHVAVSEYWACGEVKGSGWFAVGLPVRTTTCLAVSAKDGCGKPAPGTAIIVTGIDDGFRAEAWTDSAGRTCLEMPPSEGVGVDLDFDGLGGEVFRVAVAAERQGSVYPVVNSLEINAASGAAPAATCADPSRCQQLTIADDTSYCGE